jgi:hypothetical protein
VKRCCNQKNYKTFKHNNILCFLVARILTTAASSKSRVHGLWIFPPGLHTIVFGEIVNNFLLNNNIIFVSSISHIKPTDWNISCKTKHFTSIPQPEESIQIVYRKSAQEHILTYRQEAKEGCRKVQSEELHTFYSSLNIIKMIVLRNR